MLRIARPDMGQEVARREVLGVELVRDHCLFFAGLIEISLAYDQQEFWNRSAHLLFADPAGVPDYLRNAPRPLVDVPAALALVDWPLEDAARLDDGHDGPNSG